MAGRVVLECSEYPVAELLVEAARLEAVGVYPDIGAAARPRLPLGATQEVAAEPCTAQRLGQPQQAHEQPLPSCRAPQSAHDLSRVALYQHGEDALAVRLGVDVVVSDDAGENCVVGSTGRIGDQDLGRHASALPSPLFAQED